MRVALIHDWLTGMRGGERCLEVMSAMFPQADIYTMIYQSEQITPQIQRHDPKTSFLQNLPGVRKYYRYLLPAYPAVARDIGRQIEKTTSGYDLVISVSHAFAKNVSTQASTKHLSYCLTPMRYVWDQYGAYFGDRSWEPLVRPIAAQLRRWDVRQTDGVDELTCISNFVADRIQRTYGRSADVIYPPVSTEWITPCTAKDPGKGFLCATALVPYKNVDLIVRTFNQLGLPLTIVGRGPEGARLKSLAKPNIRFIDFASDAELAQLYRDSEAMVFAAEEDFGMTPVEMQAAGRPVIAYGKGGSLETVTVEPGKASGVFFSDLSAASLAEAIEYFLDHKYEFEVNNCTEQAREFSVERFISDFSSAIARCGLEVESAPSIEQRLHSVVNREAPHARVVGQC